MEDGNSKNGDRDITAFYRYLVSEKMKDVKQEEKRLKKLKKSGNELEKYLFETLRKKSKLFCKFKKENKIVIHYPPAGSDLGLSKQKVTPLEKIKIILGKFKGKNSRINTI